MYVERRPLKDLPKGAQVLSEDEVVQYYDNYIFGTSHTKDVWFLKHGFVIAGCTAFCTNYYLVNYYRRRCRIDGFVTAILMNACIVAVPSAFAVLYHYTECRRRILLQNLCTNCLYGRAAVAQNLFGILYALGPSALGCLVVAGIRDTYPVPGFGSISQIKGTYEIWKKFTKRKIPAICALFAANTAIITYITYKQLDDKDRLDDILKEQHQKLKAVAAHYQEKK